MKSLSTLLIALFSLYAFPALASEAPTLDDTDAGQEMATPQVEPLAEESAPMEPANLEVAPDEPDQAPTKEDAPLLVSVSEMVIATAIENREPVEIGTLFTTDTERLYCHSRIASIVPTTIVHVWYRNGERMAEVPLAIGAASSWRTWSSKAMVPATPASWRVEIVTEDGTLLAQTDFSVE